MKRWKPWSDSSSRRDRFRVTDQVRFDKREFWKLLEDLRETLARERGKSRGY